MKLKVVNVNGNLSVSQGTRYGSALYVIRDGISWSVYYPDGNHVSKNSSFRPCCRQGRLESKKPWGIRTLEQPTHKFPCLAHSTGMHISVKEPRVRETIPQACFAPERGFPAKNIPVKRTREPYSSFIRFI
uniref:Uncharacterized protein n=1 Tax=Kalanchoe fedtschenkoi TaxID=63787 RepID=A0A7N0SYL0_KALFE